MGITKAFLYVEFWLSGVRKLKKIYSVHLGFFSKKIGFRISPMYYIYCDNNFVQSNGFYPLILDYIFCLLAAIYKVGAWVTSKNAENPKLICILLSGV